jgi:hypothetical protein
LASVVGVAALTAVYGVALSVDELFSMKAIYKYQCPVKEKFDLSLPKGAQIVRVDDVEGMFFLWAIVDIDPATPTEVRRFECYKTGAKIDTPTSNLFYLGFWKVFIQMELCLYVFEVIE